MLDLSAYRPTIDLPRDDIHEWFQPVYDRGRAAAFVDTGFLRALLDQQEQRHEAAKLHFQGASANFYTTGLVFAEATRQIAKHKTASFETKTWMFEQVTELVIGEGTLTVCSPPREMIHSAYLLLVDLRSAAASLDLCDALSLVVLDYARHNRILGFDSHFNLVGGSLEP